MQSYYETYYCKHSSRDKRGRKPEKKNEAFFSSRPNPLLERLSFTFTSNGKREFVPRGPLYLSFTVISTHKLVFQAIFYPKIFSKNCFEQLLPAQFLFSENLNLNLTFTVCRVREALTLYCDLTSRFVINQAGCWDKNL